MPGAAPESSSLPAGARAAFFAAASPPARRSFSSSLRRGAAIRIDLPGRVLGGHCMRVEDRTAVDLEELAHLMALDASQPPRHPQPQRLLAHLRRKPRIDAERQRAGAVAVVDLDEEPHEQAPPRVLRKPPRPARLVLAALEALANLGRRQHLAERAHRADRARRLKN